jgi:WD40 repeat protein
MITLSFDAWREGHVAPTTHSVTVLPARPGPKAEPVAANLVASLRSPERKGNVFGIEFSPDGSRLCSAGYPHGVVQFWDLVSRKEVRRIETPPGLRGSAAYTLLTPDWKTLYVPVERRTVKPFERDGKRLYRIEYDGEIRVWDVASGKEKAPLRPEAGSAPVHAKLAPGGRFLVVPERPGYETSGRTPRDVTVVWDLSTGKKHKLSDSYVNPTFFPDGKTVAVSLRDWDTRTSAVKLLDLAKNVGKELARLNCPVKDRFFSVRSVAPDGSVVAVALGGKKAAPMEVWFLDGRTLAERGKFVGKGDPEAYGWGNGLFTPDGKRFVVIDGSGNAILWNVAGRKVERELPLGGARSAWQLAISRDG